VTNADWLAPPLPDARDIVTELTAREVKPSFGNALASIAACSARMRS
jgi:hypothetical protein